PFGPICCSMYVAGAPAEGQWQRQVQANVVCWGSVARRLDRGTRRNGRVLAGEKFDGAGSHGLDVDRAVGGDAVGQNLGGKAGFQAAVQTSPSADAELQGEGIRTAQRR